MATSIEIIDKLIEEIPSKITKLNNYNTDKIMEVRYGQFMSTSFSQRPAISFWTVGEPIKTEDPTLGSIELILDILLWGYTDSAYESIKLGVDLRKFLYSSDFTYSINTELSSEGIKYYGDKSEAGEPALSMLVLPFIINFSENF